MNKTIKNYMLGASLIGMGLTTFSCQDIEYPEHSNKSELGQIYINVRVPQLDPNATPVYKSVYGTYDKSVSDTVYFDVEYNLSEKLDDVTDLSKVFIVASIPVGATITPGLGGLRDLTQPMDITIAAADGTADSYVLKARLKKSAAKSILSFGFSIGDESFSGIVDDANFKVSYMVANPDLQELIAQNPVAPQISLSPRATISPDLSIAQDFSKDVEYTVTAQDGSTQVWTIVQTEPQELEYGIGYTRKSWSLSASEMGFEGSLDYRGMAVTSNYVVVAARDFGCLLYDKETGESRGKAALPTDLDASNKAQSMYVAKDAAGKLSACSFPSWTTGGNFVLYYWKDGETSAPVRLIQKAGMGDSGRKYAVRGDLSGNAIVYVTSGKGNSVFKFYIENGVWNKDKDEKISIPGTTFTFLCTPVPLTDAADSQFVLIDQQATGVGSVTLHSATGTQIASMSDDAKCVKDGLTADGSVFTFNNATYLMYMDMQSALKGRLKLMDITSLDKFTMSSTNPEYGTFEILKTDFMTSTSNGNGTGSCDFDLAADGKKAYIYMMLTSGGVMKYELTNIAL